MTERVGEAVSGVEQPFLSPGMMIYGNDQGICGAYCVPQ